MIYPFLFEVHVSSTIGISQSRQAMRTVFVARTDVPQQRQAYFLVLDLRGGRAAAPSCAPVPVI